MVTRQEDWLKVSTSHERGAGSVFVMVQQFFDTEAVIAVVGCQKLDKIETTFAFIKPDAFSNAPSILAIAEANGFTVLASTSLTLSKEQVEQFNDSYRQKR